MRVSGISTTAYTSAAGADFSQRGARKLDGTQPLFSESTIIQDILDIKSALTMPRIESTANLKPLRSPFDEDNSEEDDKDDSDTSDGDGGMPMQHWGSSKAQTGSSSTNSETAGSPEQRRAISAYETTKAAAQFGRASASAKHFDFGL